MLNKLFRTIFPAMSPADIVKQYHIPSKIKFNFQTKDGWTVATSEDLPGFVTEARNDRELLEMINDGILTYFDVPRRAGDTLHGKLVTEGHGIISLNEQPQTV